MPNQPVTVEEFDPVALFDFLCEKLAIPKPGPLLDMLAPKTILKSLGIKTLDELTEEALARVKAELMRRKII